MDRTAGASARTSSTRRRIVDEIGLVQDDDRRRAALPGDDEIALDAPRVEVVIETGDEEDRVDVGGDDLLFGRIAGGAPREAAEPRQHGADPGVAAVRGGSTATQSPTRESRRGRGLMPQPSGDAREPFLLPGQDPVDVRVLEADARRRSAPRGDGLEQRLEARRPPERGRSSVIRWLTPCRTLSAVSRQDDLSDCADGRELCCPSACARLLAERAGLLQTAQHFGDAPGLRDAAARRVRRLRRRRPR